MATTSCELETVIKHLNSNQLLTRDEVKRRWKEAYEKEALCNIVSDVVYF